MEWAPSEKLVYFYLVLAEPQTFTGVRQGLDIGVKTVDRALRRLREDTSFRTENTFTGSRDWNDWGNHVPFFETFFSLSLVDPRIGGHVLQVSSSRMWACL